MIFTIHFGVLYPHFWKHPYRDYDKPLWGSLMHVVPRTPRVEFRWFLNHQNGWCDLRLGSDAAIRSWLCLGHPVESPPVGPPLVIGVGWNWNKGKTSPSNHFQWGFTRKRGDFPWLYVGLPEVNCWKKSGSSTCVFCMKTVEKWGDFPWQLAWLYSDFCCINPITPPNCFTNWFRSWFGKWIYSCKYGPFGW